MKKKSIFLLLPFAAMALAGCGDKPTPDPCESAVVVLNKQAITLGVGDSETLLASMSVEGCSLGDVAWSSNHPEIAKVEDGKVTGVSAGTAIIEANGATCTVTVTANDPIVHVTSLEPDTPLSAEMEMVVGDKVEINIKVLPENATDSSLTITSNRPSVVQVADGYTELVAVAKGDAVITVVSNQDPDVKTTISIHVNPKVLVAPEKTVDGLDLLHNETLNDGDYVYFTAINEMNSYVMMAYESGNNIKPAENTVVDDKLGVNTQGYLYYVVKNDDNTYSFVDYTNGRDNPRYLQAGSSKLTAVENFSDKCKFNVSIVDGKANIVCADSSVTTNTMAYNSGSGLFSCYEPDKVSKQKSIQLYRADSSHEIPVTGVEMEAEKYEVPVDGELKVGAHVLPRFATDQEIQYSLTNVEPVDSITLEGNVLKSSGVGSATLVARSNSGNVEASVPVTSHEVTPIVANGMYTISHTRDGVAYYMMNEAGKTAITTDADDATVVDFIKVDHKINTYRIKVSDNSTEYLHADEKGALSFVEGVENASEFLISEGSKESGAYDITIEIGGAVKHLGIPSSGELKEYKLYASASLENTDLTAGVIKHLLGITIDSKPTKLEYFKNQVLDTTGMVVTAHFDNETSKVITDYDVSKDPFTEVGDEIVVTVSYKGCDATFTVKVKERALLSIAIDGDMTNKNYQRTESFDPTGLRVMGTYENQDNPEVLDSALYTLSYDPEKANTIGDNQTVTVTATMNAGSVEPASKAITGVNVSKLHVTDVVIAGKTTQVIEVGQSLALTATVKPTDADDTLVVFSAEEGKESIISVSQDGIVVANGVGKAKVIATSLEEGVDTPVTDTVTIEVVEALPSETNDGYKRFVKSQDITEGATVKFFVSRDGKVYGMGANEAKDAKHQLAVECSVEEDKISVVPEVAEFEILTNGDGTYSFLKGDKYLSANGGATNGLKLVGLDEGAIPANAKFNIVFANGRPSIVCANEKTSAGVLSFYDPTISDKKTPSFSCVKSDDAESNAKVAMFIKQLPVSGVNIIQDSLTLDKEEVVEGNLNYEITPTAAIPESVVWSLKNNTGAVSIDQTGKVTALEAGSDVAVITVNGEFTDECPITVNYGPTVVTGVSLDNSSLSIVEGAKATLVATIEPADASNKNVSWSSSDETVAKVSEGVITALKPGTAEITVTTADQGKTAKCNVTVTAAKASTLSAADDFVGTYASNEYERFAIDGSGLAFNCYQAGNTGSAGSKQIQIKKSVGMIWNTSPVNNIFKLSFSVEDGAKLPSVYAGNTMKPTDGTLIDGVMDGDTGTVSYDFGGLYSYFVLVGNKDGASVLGDVSIKYASISEYSIPVSALTLNANTLDLTPTSDPEQLEATIAPVSASDKTVTWSIKEGSDDCITLVDGLVTPKTTGTATVVCTSNANPNAYAECVVTVSATEKKINVDELDVYELTKDSLGLTSSYADSKSGADITFTQLGWYSSSIQGSKDKGSSITNAYAFSRAIKYIKFNVAVDKPSSKATLYFGSEAAPSEGGINLGNGTDYGFVAGKSIVIKAPADSTYFKLAYTNAAINFSSIEIGFKDYVAPAVESVTLDQETLEMNVGGDPATLTPTILPLESEPKSMVWESSNESVATVNNGVVTAVGEGTANITYTVDEKVATCVVTVSASKTMASIAITGSLTNDTYGVGDKYSLDGLTVTATYTDTTTEVLDASKYTLTADKTDAAIADTSITVTAHLLNEGAGITDATKVCNVHVLVKSSIINDKKTGKTFVSTDPNTLDIDGITMDTSGLKTGSGDSQDKNYGYFMLNKGFIASTSAVADMYIAKIVVTYTSGTAEKGKIDVTLSDKVNSVLSENPGSAVTKSGTYVLSNADQSLRFFNVSNVVAQNTQIASIVVYWAPIAA